MDLRRHADMRSWQGRSAVWVAASLMLLFFNAAVARAATVCEVNVPRLNLRERPSRSAHISGVLDRRTQILVVGGCNAGWVRVVSDRGATRGYVGGWALQEVTQQSDAPQASLQEGTAVAALGAEASGVGAESERSWNEEASVMPQVGVSQQESDSGKLSAPLTMVFKPETGTWSSSSSNGGSAFSNEVLAVQMTENRLKVLALERRMQLVERTLAQLQGRLASGGQVQ